MNLLKKIKVIMFLIVLFSFNNSFSATYNLSVPLTAPSLTGQFSTCTIVSSTYLKCNNSVALNWGDVLNLNGSGMTIEFANTSSFGNVSINPTNTAPNLKLIFSNGSTTINGSPVINADITYTANGTFQLGGGSTLAYKGNLTSTNATSTLAVGSNVSVVGLINAANIFNVVGNNTSFSDKILANGNITISASKGLYSADVQSNANITLSGSSSGICSSSTCTYNDLSAATSGFMGNLIASNGTITMGGSSYLVKGSISGLSVLGIGSSLIVGGGITATNNITFGNLSYVGGNVLTTNGNITINSSPNCDTSPCTFSSLTNSKVGFMGNMSAPNGTFSPTNSNQLIKGNLLASTINANISGLIVGGSVTSTSTNTMILGGQSYYGLDVTSNGGVTVNSGNCSSGTPCSLINPTMGFMGDLTANGVITFNASHQLIAGNITGTSISSTQVNIVSGGDVIATNGGINIAQVYTPSGGLSATNGAVKISQSVINQDISSVGIGAAISLGGSSVVNGDIYSDGFVDFTTWPMSTVYGDISGTNINPTGVPAILYGTVSARTGDVNLNASEVYGNIMALSSTGKILTTSGGAGAIKPSACLINYNYSNLATITANWGSSLSTVCCYNSATNSCSNSCLSTPVTPKPGTCSVPTNNKINFGGGVLANYFYNNKNLTGSNLLKGEAINLSPTYTNFGSSAPTSINGSPYNTTGDNFSINYKGYMVIGKTGFYKFSMNSDDGSVLYLNCSNKSPNVAGKTNWKPANMPAYPVTKAIDQWNDHTSTTYTYSCPVALNAGDIVPFAIDYYDNTAPGNIYLQWEATTTLGGSTFKRSKQYIPRGSTGSVGSPGLYYNKDEAIVSSLSNLNITSTATASTCSPQTVSITALNSSGTALTNFTGSVTLSTSTGHGTWGIGTGKGSLSGVGSDNGAATYTFVAGDLGVANLTLSNTHSENVTATVSSASPALSKTSSSIGFRDNVFTFVNDTVQVAGKSQSMSSTLKLKDITTGICSNATLYTGSKNLKAWVSRDLNDTAGIAPKIGAVSLPSSEPVAANVNLNFTSGVANFALDTTDVGAYTVSFKDISGSFSTTSPTGTSSLIVTKPFALALTNINKSGFVNPATATATGTVFARAGESFSATIGSYLWNGAVDTNNDGIPDAGATLAQVTANGLTPSFKSNVTLNTGIPYYPATALDTPAGTAVAGLLSNATILGSNFSGGSATVNNISYGEVGSFTLKGTSNNFLGYGSNILSYANSLVGRFVPADFGFTINSPNFSTNSGTFNYLGKAFSYGTQPVITLIPKNLNNVALKNYVGSYARLDSSSVSTLYTSSSGTLDVSSATSPSVSSNADGTVSVTLNSGSGFYIQKLSLVAPFNPDIKVSLTVNDKDGIISSVSPSVGDTTLNNGIQFTSGKEFRYGRLYMTPSYGSELSSVPIYLQAQYYNGTGFVTNTLDNITSLSINNFSVGNYVNITPGNVVVYNNGSSTFVNGKKVFYAKVSGIGSKVGTADVALNLSNVTTINSCSVMPNSTPSNLTYLYYDWCGSSKSPSAKLGFGIYKNTDKIIYIRDN